MKFPDFHPADKERLTICVTWDNTNSTHTHWQGVMLSLQELKVTNSAGLTELSFPYPGICPNLFLQLPEAKPHLVHLLFKRTSNCAEISLGNLAWYHLHKLQVWWFFLVKMTAC